jgi:hypothetical protein
MTSILKVDSILKADGSAHDFVSSNILETFTVVCNGEAITVPSGTYTPTNVTSSYALTDSHVVTTGSSISYTPPTGTTSVIYEFQYKVAWENTSYPGIIHTAMRIDGTQITGSRQTSGYAGTYDQMHNHFKWRIPIGGTASSATGRVASWTSAKTIDMTARRYNSSYPGKVHHTHYWDGGNAGFPDLPILSITALK